MFLDGYENIVIYLVDNFLLLEDFVVLFNMLRGFSCWFKWLEVSIILQRDKGFLCLALIKNGDINVGKVSMIP